MIGAAARPASARRCGRSAASGLVSRQLLSDPGYRQGDGAGAAGARGGAVVSVLFPARARPRGPCRQPARASPDIVDSNGRRTGSSTMPASSARRSRYDNPDYVDVVIHSYRHRFGLAEGDPQYADMQRRLAALPSITVPTITLDGAGTALLPRPTARPARRNSPAAAAIASFRARAIICRRKRPRRLPRR